MRRPYIAGNWKMNLDWQAIAAFVEAVRDPGFCGDADVRVGLFAPNVYLRALVEALASTRFLVGGQTCHPAVSGAFTGEVSAGMLKDVGAQAVIVGHSERRHVFGETDADVHARVGAALSVGLDVILCVGETLEEREAGRTAEVVVRQLDAGLAGLDGPSITRRITVAYEPVWAIGTGLTATPDQAQEVHAQIRQRVAASYKADVADRLIIQYGGSVKPSNVADLMACPDVDGALVGGASLDPQSFQALVRLGK